MKDAICDYFVMKERHRPEVLVEFNDPIVLEDAKVEEICAEIDGVVVPANYNCPGQLVISGETAAVEKACEAWLQSSVYTQIGLSPIFPHGRLCFKSMPSFLFSSTLLPLARTLRILP
jgi:malonyl CoA-acyl carrier protein transacylase